MMKRDNDPTVQKRRWARTSAMAALCGGALAAACGSDSEPWAGGTADAGHDVATGGTGGAAGGGGGGGGGCSTGFADCDGKSSNGCEADLSNSPQNCGACGKVCPGGAPNMLPSCTAGTCSFGCQPGYGDCDNNVSNGCELPLSSDPNNCGTCGHVCSSDAGKPGCVEGACAVCPEVAFNIQTQQACAISVLPGFKLDAEAFITIAGTQHRVFALNRWGTGHIIGWCDATTIGLLVAAFDALGYLAHKDDPKVASFGDSALCDPTSSIAQLPYWITYLGDDLPATYLGNAAQLAADWDVIMFCGFRIPWTNPWDTELSSFVADHGKGLFAIMDYEGVVKQQDFDNMSTITKGSGIKFEPLNLTAEPAPVNVVFDCVPDLTPPVK